MKRAGLIFFTCVCAVTLSMAQMRVWKDGKIIYEKAVTAVDSVTFGQDNQLPDQQHNYDYLFDLKALPEIRITVSVKDWNQFLQNFQDNPANDLYVPAQFDMLKGTDSWHRDSVGLRPRGNTSRRCAEEAAVHSKSSSWIPAHFGVKFTEYDSGERFFGVDRLIFKFFKDDPAFCREVFCYDLFHRFGAWTAPYASYCRFSIFVQGDAKPVYLGVYEMVENPRKGWLDDRLKDGKLPDTEGNLWKCAYGANLSDSNAALMSVEDNVYTLKTNKTAIADAQKELQNFINGLRSKTDGSAALKTWLEQNMDVDLFLRVYAVNVVVGMWDDYWINNNNYFFYFDSNHKFYFIPFDYDNTLGTSSIITNSGTQNPLYWGERDESRMLVKKVLSVKEYENKYVSYLKQLVSSDDLMSEAGSKQRIQGWHSMISPYIANDTRTDDIMSRHSIGDEPAYWGNCSFYRLLSGNAEGGSNGNANFFSTKAKTINGL